MLDKAYANLECAGLLELSLKQVDALLFFFQAEDGILDIGVTGVQTCALPIYRRRSERSSARKERLRTQAATRLWHWIWHSNREPRPKPLNLNRKIGGERGIRTRFRLLVKSTTY